LELLVKRTRDFSSGIALFIYVEREILFFSLLEMLYLTGICILLLIYFNSKQLEALQLAKSRRYIAFFHPFCDSGGGGERVLWNAVKALLEEYPLFHIVIYTWDGCNTTTILQSVQKQFGFDIDPTRVQFLKLRTWRYLEANRYPYLTLILSSLGSLYSGWEAIHLFKPEIVVESVGFAFLYPLFRLCGSKVVAYVHYPTISSDMLQIVQSRKVTFNNSSAVAKSYLLSSAKYVYYHVFSIIYGWAGSFANVVMVNSTWTKGHISEIWGSKTNPIIVYPPCDTSQLVAFPFTDRKRIILSIAQFRYKVIDIDQKRITYYRLIY
jgi:alpha-1,2-mannosyltransferase